MQLGLIPEGGNDITRAIAQSFNTDLKSAEQAKVVNGAATLAPRDEVEPVIVPVLGDDSGTNTHIRRSELIGTILPCLDAILTHLAEQLNEDTTFSSVANRFVLTGGGAGFDGLVEKVSTNFGGNARIGKTKQIKNLPNKYDSCTFNVCVGLLVYAKMRMQNKVLDDFQEKPAVVGWFGRVKEWLKQNL